MIKSMSLILILLWSCALENAATITHYAIDFEAPTHFAGATPATGPGSNTPSSVVFGNPIVTNGFSNLPSQALVFNTTGNTTPCCYYDQIRLALTGGYTNYNVSFDIETDQYVGTGASNTFTLYFDTPEVRNLYFHRDGSINTFIPFHGSAAVGSFSDNTVYNMNINIDLLKSSWTISQDGFDLFTGAFTTSGGDIFSLRYSFGNNWTTNFDSVAIDNIYVTSTVVPVPSAVWLLGAGLLSLFAATRRIKGVS